MSGDTSREQVGCQSEGSSNQKQRQNTRTKIEISNEISAGLRTKKCGFSASRQFYRQDIFYKITNQDHAYSDHAHIVSINPYLESKIQSV
jgi:hypothetical protein